MQLSEQSTFVVLCLEILSRALSAFDAKANMDSAMVLGRLGGWGEMSSGEKAGQHDFLMLGLICEWTSKTDWIDATFDASPARRRVDFRWPDSRTDGLLPC